MRLPAAMFDAGAYAFVWAAVRGIRCTLFPLELEM
jgi:hypothetical protein